MACVVVVLLLQQQQLQQPANAPGSVRGQLQ
jgi:hypothetical protein